MDDRAVVERQLGRNPRAFLRVARRCPFGAPAVTEQAPYDSAGEPFPTTYYLTCRHLVAAVSRLEAAGGIERWSAALAGRSQSLPPAWRRRRRTSARSGMSSPADRSDRRAAPRSTSGSAARPGPRSSSASTPTSRSRSRAPATSSASESSRRSSRSGRSSCCTLDPVGVGAVMMAVDAGAAAVGGGHRRFESQADEPVYPAARAVRGRDRRDPEAGRGDVHALTARRRLRDVATTGCGRRSKSESPPRAGPARLRRPGRGVPPVRARRDGLRAVTISRAPRTSRARRPRRTRRWPGPRRDPRGRVRARGRRRAGARRPAPSGQAGHERRRRSDRGRRRRTRPEPVLIARRTHTPPRM